MKATKLPILMLAVIFGMGTFLVPTVYADNTEYVWVVKVDDSHNQVIVQRSNGELWLLEYGVGCTSLWFYEGRKVVLYSPGLFAGVGSEIIIPDRDQSCRVWDSSQIANGGWNGNSSGTVVPVFNTLALFVIGNKNYIVNGEVRTMDVAPIIEGGRTYLPVRYVAEALGVPDTDVVYEAETKTVAIIKQDMVAIMQVCSTKLIVNDATFTMDVAPKVKNGRVMLPLRWIASALGAQVEWDPENQAVVIWN